MAAFQCIPNLIIFNVFILPGLALPSSPSATPFNSSPNTQRYKVASQKQTEFPSKLESDLIVVVFGQHSGKAWTGTLELDGETGEDHPGDSNSVLNIEQVSPGDGEIRRTELEKVKKDWGSFKPWGKRAQSEAENRNFGRDQRFDREAWRNNIDKYWIKRSEDDSEGTSDNIKPNTGIKSKWEENNIMDVWEKRRVYWDAVPNSDNYSDKENNASNGKREWTPDNLPRVYGKRNSHLVPNWDGYSDKEKDALKGKREWTTDNLPRVYGKRNIQSVA